ncbi:MAG: aminoglycoside phosphotransferase family protein [Chloroflexota bacterium]|nr:MAG: aminoglycoside phosphotransferase family protein [Chloroflexota bacterium]
MYVEAAICDYLREEIFPQLAPPPYAEIEITSLGTRKPVCLFFEKSKNIMVVGKLFKRGVVPLEDAWLEADKEYSNLKLLREQLGMDGDADHVVAPLGESRKLSALLVTERALGQTLDYYIGKAIFDQQHDELFQTLGYLARFFAKLHEASKTERPLSPELPRFYLNAILNSLEDKLIDYPERDEIEKYALRWWHEERVFASDRETIVHGDATPTNFLFDNGNVTAIDLESMNWADRCWDLGFIAAELKHHFMWRTGNKWTAEPFIGHFLWEYAVNYGDTNLFRTITYKLPLYMALGLLRIARNFYVGETHRKRLVMEANKCLKYGL